MAYYRLSKKLWAVYKESSAKAPLSAFLGVCLLSSWKATPSRNYAVMKRGYFSLGEL